MGGGSENAGGARGKKNRMDVLDRMSRLGSGPSAGQRHDWTWFKDAWDKEMLKQHAAEWPTVFAKWMQHVLDDETTNSFPKFVHDETDRVCKGIAVLHLPGG